MLPSLIMNALIVLFVIGSVYWDFRKADPHRAVFRFFTTLSNLFCAAAALIMVTVGENPPLWALLLKYIGTAAVTVTMLTVCCFLLPVTKNWKAMFGGAELFLHLICPLLAIVSFLLEKTAMPAWIIPLGVLPVILYGFLYLYKVLRAPEERRWEDFYYLNRDGKWGLSFVLMVAAAAVISLVLWIV
jgi:hypothetical protein